MVVFFGVMAVVTASKFYTPAEVIPWRTDLAAALAEARTANKPVLLYFTAEWCGPCQYMRRNIWTEPSVARAMESYVPVRVDHDQRPDLIRAYQVEGMPWFGVLDPDGRPTRILNRGLETPEQMIAWLKQ
ncbi:MAG: hypothetical protein QOF78_2372 [Phycisphaerales bacterium]|jgi:uncharacterized protein YyaL (SSP411 family)|nr:hypothetical protein [Phycisphaerales bacterium]